MDRENLASSALKNDKPPIRLWRMNCVFEMDQLAAGRLLYERYGVDEAFNAITLSFGIREIRAPLSSYHVLWFLLLGKWVFHEFILTISKGVSEIFLALFS